MRWTGVSPPLRGPRFGPRNPHPAATGVGRPLGTPLRAMVDVRGRPARLRWATLDGCAAPTYAVAIEHLFWATPTLRVRGRAASLRDVSAIALDGVCTAPYADPRARAGIPAPPYATTLGGSSRPPYAGQRREAVLRSRNVGRWTAPGPVQRNPTPLLRLLYKIQYSRRPSGRGPRRPRARRRW